MRRGITWEFILVNQIIGYFWQLLQKKVDLLEISILELASQYLNFIDQMKIIDIDLAADYIVMASWLAFLKSKLLLPDEDNEDVSAKECWSF